MSMHHSLKTKGFKCACYLHRAGNHTLLNILRVEFLPGFRLNSFIGDSWTAMT